MRFQVTIALTAAAVLLLSATALAQDETDETSTPVRLGYVDIQRAIAEVADGRQAMSQLEEALSERQATLDEREEQLRQLTQQLDQDLVMLDADQRRARLLEYQQQVEQYQQMYMTNQQELYMMEQEATREIVERMLAIVADLSREQGLTMVFEKTRSALVWAADGLDLTDEVIQRYEAAN